MSSPVADILLVEDNANDAELFTKALQKYHIYPSVQVCVTGEEALRCIFKDGNTAGVAIRQPKVVILDLKLPKVNGFDVLREIKKHEETQDIPIVIFTSSEEDQDVKLSYKLGANSYVVKPIDYEAYHHVIRILSIYWLSINLSTP